MKNYLFILFVALMVRSATAQHELNINDSIPDVVYQITGYHADSVNLRSLSGKLVILDFWDVQCAACIGKMPEMERLQQTFGDRIQVILITTDDSSKVNRLRENSAFFRTIKLPMITGDRQLAERLPFITVPTHVWIDENGIITQLTNGNNTTETAIRDHLAGKAVSLPVKYELKDYDPNEPLWLEGGGRHVDRIRFFSYITKKIDGRGGMRRLKTDPETGRITNIMFTNVSITDLFRLSYYDYPGHPFEDLNRVILDVDDPYPFTQPNERDKLDQWSEKHAYCYELSLPPKKAENTFQFMRDDLSEYFGLTVRVEKREVACLVLRSTGDISALYTKGGKPKLAFNRLTSKYAELVNRPIDDLAYCIKSIIPEHNDFPLINEIQGDARIDALIPNAAETLDDFNRSLSRYGIKLVQEKRKIDMLVIAKKGSDQR